jgi:hypothetical protein
MRMRTARKIAGWVGTAMWSLAASFAPSYLTEHTHASLGVVFVSGIIALFCSAFWFFTKDQERPPETANAIANTNTFNR